MVADLISLESYRAHKARLLRKNFAAWERMNHIEWAQKVRRMPDGHGGTRPFTFNYFPPQREMYESIFDPEVFELIYEIFSRGTKSEAVLTAIGYRIDEMPARILVMWPTVGQGEKWSKDNLMGELIQPTPCLNEILGEDVGRRKGSSTILHKGYPGGLINIFGANAPGEIRRAKGNFLYAAEIDAIPDAPSDSESQKDEGDPLRIFKMRGTEYPDTIEIYESYPSLKGKSRIDAKYQESDKRQWFVTCLECGGEPYVMHRKDLRYESDKPESAMMECPRCHNLLSDDQRYAMMMGGDPNKPRFDLWKPTAEFKGRRGYQANSMLWPHPVDKKKYPGGYLQMLAQQEIDVTKSDNPERARRVMVNTIDAEPYEPDHMDKVEHTDLFLRREDYEPRELLPDNVLLVVFGADLQADRAEIKFKGFGKNGEAVQSWGIEYRVVRGAAIGTDLWEKCENVLRNIAWKRSDGSYLSPAIGLFDSGYKPDYVYNFCVKMRGMGIRVYPSLGSTILGKPIISKPVNRGKPPSPVYDIGTHEAKDIIYQRLELKDPNAPGYMHFPKIAPFSEVYFQQLTSEESTMERGKDGKFYRYFWLPETSKTNPGSRNEALDCEVLCDAAERILRPNYARLAENLKLATKVEQEVKQPERRVLPNRGLVRNWRR